MENKMYDIPLELVVEETESGMVETQVCCKKCGLTVTTINMPLNSDAQIVDSFDVWIGREIRKHMFEHMQKDFVAMQIAFEG